MKLAESITPEAFPVFAGTERVSQNMADTSDAPLAASLPGDFRNGYGEVNGTRIHYVEGGKGTPVLLLPGWPQTWWEFHKIMPELAKRHRVIAVDLRGMGGFCQTGVGLRQEEHGQGYSRADPSARVQAGQHRRTRYRSNGRLQLRC